MELKFACGYHIFLALQRQISVKELAQRLLHVYILYTYISVSLKNLVEFSFFFVNDKRKLKTLSYITDRFVKFNLTSL